MSEIIKPRVVDVGVWHWFGLMAEPARRTLATQLREDGVTHLIIPINNVDRGAGLVYDYRHRGTVKPVTDAHIQAIADYVAAWQSDGFHTGVMMWGFPHGDHMRACSDILQRIDEITRLDIAQHDLEGHWIHQYATGARNVGGREAHRALYRALFFDPFGARFNITTHGGIKSLRGTLEPYLYELSDLGGSASGQFYSVIVPGKEWSRDPFYTAGKLQETLVPDWEKIFPTRNYAGLDVYGQEHAPYTDRYREAMEVEIAAALAGGADRLYLWSAKQLYAGGRASRERRAVIREYTGGEAAWAIRTSAVLAERLASQFWWRVVGSLVGGIGVAALVDAIKGGA